MEVLKGLFLSLFLIALFNLTILSEREPMFTGVTSNPDVARSIASPAGGSPIVRIWANANTIPPFIDDFRHSISVGSEGRNLFLVEFGRVYSSVGPSGNTPGSFSLLGSLPSNAQINEGSAFFSTGVTSVLFATSEIMHKVFAITIIGSGSNVSPGSIATINGELLPAPTVTGSHASFGQVEGIAILNGTPVFDNGTPFFTRDSASEGSTFRAAVTFPIVDPNWSGSSLLVVDQSNDNLLAFPIDNDGTVGSSTGISLANTTHRVGSAWDGVAVTPDGKFAYVKDEVSPSDTYRFDLQRVDSTGGNAHIKGFAPGINLQNDGLVVLDDSLYVTAGTGGLYRRKLDSVTGDLGAPELFTTFPGAGNAHRMATDGTCIYVTDSGRSLVFQVCLQSFDICLQDDSNGNLLQFNSESGDYQFTNCSGFTLNGTGSLIRRGSVITLQDYAADRRVLARIDGSANKGAASVQIFSLVTTFTITDRNTANNTCSCTAH